MRISASSEPTEVEVVLVQIHNGRVRLGFNAPPNVCIKRTELAGWQDERAKEDSADEVEDAMAPNMSGLS